MFLGINFLLGVEAVVAITAVVGFVLFSKIVEKEFAAANGRFAIVGGLLEELAADVLLGHGFAFHEFFQLLEILAGEEGNALTFASVASWEP